MPYIKKDQRPALDALVDSLPVSVAEPGELNYLLTKILLRAVGPLNELRYNDIVTIMGTLECVGAEFYRRVAVPYENIKCEVNGDVYPKPLWRTIR